MLAFLFTLGFFGRGVAAPQITTERLAFAARAPRTGTALKSSIASAMLNPYRAGMTLNSGARAGAVLNSRRTGKQVEFIQ